MEMLELRGLHKTFNPGTVNEKVALNGVSLTMEAGDFATIVGSNGAGKSTPLGAKLYHRLPQRAAQDRKSTRLNSSHKHRSRMPSSA